MKVQIETIPHSEQRYNTSGDYWEESDGTMKIVVSDMGNTDYEFLVAIHEMAEMYLARKHGISEESITAFDKQFEKGRTFEEPGDDRDAPYQNEHNFATAVERMMCAALGIKWQDYEEAVVSDING